MLNFLPTASNEEQHNQSRIRSLQLLRLKQTANESGETYRQTTEELQRTRPEMKRFYALNKRFSNISAGTFLIFVVALATPICAILFDITVGGYELQSFVGSYLIACIIIIALVGLETASVIFMEPLKLAITGDPPINTDDERLKLFSGSEYAYAKLIAIALLVGISFFNTMSALYQAQDRRSGESVFLEELDTSEFTEEELAMLNLDEDDGSWITLIIDQFWWLMPLALAGISFLLHFMILKFSGALYWAASYFFSYRRKDRQNRRYFDNLVSARQTAIQRVGVTHGRFQNEARSAVLDDPHVQVPDIPFSAHVMEALAVFQKGESEEGLVLTKFPSLDSEDSFKKASMATNGSNGASTQAPMNHIDALGSGSKEN